MNKFKQIYELLFNKYGSQGWWPVTPIGGCRGNSGLPIPIYGVGLKNEKQKFEIILGAILTQNTSWKNVEKAIINLNEKSLIDATKLNNIDEKELAQLIRPAGYYNQKAKKLKIFAYYLADNYRKSLRRLFDKPIPALREELLGIHGIGPETADSIILYAAEKPIFVVDAYTKRIFSRIGFCKPDAGYDEVQKMFMENLENEAGLFNEYHALIVEHGKNVCRTKPLCSECCIRESCEFGLSYSK